MRVSVTAGDRFVSLRWRSSPDTTLVEIVRSNGAQGFVGHALPWRRRRLHRQAIEERVRYRYTITGYDDARNAVTRSMVAVPKAPLLSPPAGARVVSPPLLAWVRVAHATYFNVQVWRKRQIFSAWPSGTSLRLKRSWIYHGRRYTLSPGRYRWYVWPGYGARAARRYGRLLGASSFVIARTANRG